MRFDDRLEIERAMVIYAHPDDAEFGVSGTVATWARAGVEVTYCMVTNGASGSQDETMTRQRLRDIRRAEQEAAAGILGVARVVGLEFEDGYLEPTLEVRKAVARQFRLHRPDVVITMDPTARFIAGRYVNHPDHIATGEVVARSINPDASTRQRFPELWQEERLEPHKPKALFLMGFGSGDRFVDISPVLEVKLAALRAHASQFGPSEEDFVRGLMAEEGKRAGVGCAESYRILYLER